MATKRSFTLDVSLRLQIVGYFLEYLYVGLDAFRLDRAARRREITSRGQPQRTVAGAQRDDGLHRALAERPGTDKRRALVVLKRAGDDLRCRRRTAIDQHNNGLALDQLAGTGVKAGASPAWRPRVETMSPFFRNASATEPPDRTGRPDCCAGRK